MLFQRFINSLNTLLHWQKGSQKIPLPAHYRPSTAKRLTVYFITCLLTILPLSAETDWLEPYDVSWTSPSQNATESMPCGGGDIGLNVWVENGAIFIYLARSGSIDEWGRELKLGRLRVQLSPNPLQNSTTFKQVLHLKDGSVEIDGEHYGLRVRTTVWVDVKQPVVHLDIAGNQKIDVTITYENWRQDDATFVANNSAILFYHQNKNTHTLFDALVQQQGLQHIKEQLNNPLKNRVFGGLILGKNLTADSLIQGDYDHIAYTGLQLKSLKPATKHKVEVILHTQQVELQEEWDAGLAETLKQATARTKTAKKETTDWWEAFWDRSYIRMGEKNNVAPGDSLEKSWAIGQSYQLFRYLMGCNATGETPTNASGGLFSFRPDRMDTSSQSVPLKQNDSLGGYTAQRQFSLYWPLLKSGDTDLLKAQFDLYLKNLETAEKRTSIYWGHQGAYFPEQMEFIGLPTGTLYGWKRPTFFDPGIEYNPTRQYQWDTALAFCLMMLEAEQYANGVVDNYLPFIESCLRFYDEHYQYLSERRSTEKLDAAEHLILYPGTAGATYNLSTNATSTISALTTVLTRVLELDSTRLTPESRDRFTRWLSHVPPIQLVVSNGQTRIAPAKSYERITGNERPQLYTVFPFNTYGIGKTGLQQAINTWLSDSLTATVTDPETWDQNPAVPARLGLTEEAVQQVINLMPVTPARFPAFWSTGGHGIPTLDHGGAITTGLQEMLMQTNGSTIYLFPAWPKKWDVTFKLHAPYNTTIEATLKNGEIKKLTVLPESRTSDVVNLLSESNSPPKE